jgi:hypothetical protein
MTMGYDLVARRRTRGPAGCYECNIRFMIVLRSAMVAAAVPEALVYRKFISNDSLLVTRLQSRMIAKKLTTWLRADDLVLDLAESNTNAHSSLDALSTVVRAVGSKREKTELAQ